MGLRSIQPRSASPCCFFAAVCLAARCWRRASGVQEQERLLAAYDEANRDAAQRVKALEATLREREADALEERRHLEREIVRAAEAQQGKSADTAHNLRYRLRSLPPLSAVRSKFAHAGVERVESVTMAVRRSDRTETLSACRRLLEVEGKLEAAEAVAAQRERELAETIEGLRRDKRELEARAAGVDLPSMQQGDDLVRQVRARPLHVRS